MDNKFTKGYKSVKIQLQIIVQRRVNNFVDYPDVTHINYYVNTNTNVWAEQHFYFSKKSALTVHLIPSVCELWTFYYSFYLKCKNLELTTETHICQNL